MDRRYIPLTLWLSRSGSQAVFMFSSPWSPLKWRWRCNYSFWVLLNSHSVESEFVLCSLLCLFVLFSSTGSFRYLGLFYHIPHISSGNERALTHYGAHRVGNWRDRRGRSVLVSESVGCERWSFFLASFCYNSQPLYYHKGYSEYTKKDLGESPAIGLSTRRKG